MIFPHLHQKYMSLARPHCPHANDPWRTTRSLISASNMGIQRFGLRMRDYATKTTLGTITKSSSSATQQQQQQQQPPQKNIAIIDGPGLAHYIYYNLCDSSSSSTATTSSAITYDSCAKATIAWLDKLVGYGFKM